MFLAHTRPHDDFSTEFHTRQGPFTLVPLPGSREAPFRSSLVWVMAEAEARRRAALDDEALASEIEARAHGLLGAMRIEDGRGVFPMLRQSVARLTATRLALVGDAAHAFPPIGAQGLNLGLRDVEGLLDSAREARAASADIGGDAALARYAASRRADIALRTMAVDGLNWSLLADFAPVDALRGFGSAALRHIGPLRRLVMRQGLGPVPAR
jgi:2-octaprenyl-6-methoxyphenol hydroxylase